MPIFVTRGAKLAILAIQGVFKRRGRLEACKKGTLVGEVDVCEKFKVRETRPHIAISEQASVEVVKIKAASPQKKPQARYTLRVVRKFVAYLGF
jgi:hypothetical protein